MKQLAGVLVVAAALALWGCARSDQMTFHVGGTAVEMAFWEEVVAQFVEQTGSAVSLIRSTAQTEQRRQSLMVSLRSASPDPDVMLVDVAWIGQMAASGWLEPLDNYDEIDASVFFERIVTLANRPYGELIGVPVFVDGGVLYYRSDLLERYGYEHPPRTWHELRDQALHIMEQERGARPSFWGYVWQGAQYEGLVCNALEFFTSAGGGFLDSAGNPMIDAQPNRAALAFMVSLLEPPHAISPPNTFADMKEEEARQLFHNADALFQRNWPYAWPLHERDDSAVRGKTGVTVLPYFEGGQSASTLGGWHAAISRFSNRKKEAAAFVAFITSYDVQKQLALRLGYNPGRQDVYADPQLLEHYPLLARLEPVFARAIPRPMVPWYSELSLLLQRHINAALAGNVTVQQALMQAQQEAVELVERVREQ